MTDTPDPIADEVKDRFTRRFLNFALRKNEKETDQTVIDRRAQVRAQAEADIRQLRDEFRKAPLQNYDIMSEADRAAAIQDIFPQAQIRPVSGSTTISINGMLEMDPTSLRQLAPHKRDLVFAASKMEPGSAAQIEALKTISGKFRLRSATDAANGKAHLEALAQGPHADAVAALFDADSADKKGAYRAFDISNKINALKVAAQKGKPADVAAFELAQRKQGAMLAMAMDMQPDSLSDMVVNFEFAEMTLNNAICEQAQARAAAREAEERAQETQRMQADLATAADRRAALEGKQAALEGRKADVEAYLGASYREIPPDKRPLVIQYKKDVSALDKERLALDALTQENIDAFAATVRPVAPTPEDLAAVADQIIADMTSTDQNAARNDTLQQMQATLTDYTAAVPATGNAARTVDVAQDPADIALNAAAVVTVAGDLRFFDNKAAGYHTLKHHAEMADVAGTGRLEYDTDVKRKVAHYHICAREAVAHGAVVLSQIEQTGGEGHHFKHQGITAIIKMAKGQAGLATYFKK